MFKDLDIFYDDDNRCYQLRTKGVSYIIEFDDDAKTAVFESLIAKVRDSDRSLIEIARGLEAKHGKDLIVEVLSTLSEYDLVGYEDLSEVNEYTGKSEATTSGAQGAAVPSMSCETNRVLVIGDGKISVAIAKKLRGEDYAEVRHHTIDEMAGEQLNALLEEFDFFVLDGSHWNPAFTERFNVLALEHKKPWLFVGGIEEINIKVGPLFYGKQTGCYNCLIQRIKSNSAHLNYFESYERHLRKNGSSGKPDQLPQNDLFLELGASMAALEVGKFFTLWSVPVTWRAFVSLNAMTYGTTKHSLLKVPFCKVCKPQLQYNPAPWLEPITLEQ